MTEDYGPCCGNCGFLKEGRCEVHKAKRNRCDGRACGEHTVFFPKAVIERFRRECLDGGRGQG